ncbi:MAG: ParB/RepB/Spo0J family partition protein [Myxococcota bacterium]
MIQPEKKRVLGRGLSALLPQAATPAGELAKGVTRLALEDIRRDGAQPRKSFDSKGLKELADSIRAQGLIQPVLVRRDSRGYRLIAGERRWRASQLAGLKEIPAIVREATDAQAFELALVENLQRADLNPVEEAMGFRRLIEERQLSQEEVAQRVGKDRSTIANALRLLSLPEEVKGLLAQGRLDMGHARALLGLPRPSEMVALAREVVAQALSVRETERRVKEARPLAAKPKRKEARPSPHARQLVEELQRRLGTKVRLLDKGGKGTLEVDFFSYEDLDRIVGLIRR